MILYVKNPKGSTHKLLELISKFTKVSGYKVNTQKSIIFLYNINKQLLNEVKKMYLVQITIDKPNKRYVKLLYRKL